MSVVQHLALLESVEYLLTEGVSYQRAAVLVNVCVIAVIDFKAVEY